MQLLNSYCLKTTHRVICRTDAVNNLSPSLENHFIEANIYKNIRISDTTPNSVSTSAWLCATSNIKNSGVTDVGQGRATSPGKLYVKTGALLADILISVLFCFSVGCFFCAFRCALFFSWYTLPRLPDSLSFLNFFSECWQVPSLR